MAAVIAVFTIAAVAMHVLVFCRIGSHGFWTVVEYVWLSLAFLSMISLVGEYRRLTAFEELASAKGKMEESWQSVADAADRCVKFYGGSHPHGIDHPEVSEGEMEDAWNSARLWCRDLQRAVNLGKDVRHTAGWRGFIGHQNSSPFPELEPDRLDREMPDAEYLKRLERRRRPGSWFQLRSAYDSARSDAASAVNSYWRIVEHVRDLEIASRRTSAERAGLAVGPWLLAVGLALRIAKVSAGRRGLC